MKRYLLALAVMLASLPALAQTAKTTQEEYENRYALLVNRFGVAGVGIETLVSKWEADYPDNVKMLCAKFNYYFKKSQRDEIVVKEQAKFLGAAPVLTLNDSTGKKVNYFTETFYDDEMYSTAIQAMDKAIRSETTALDLRLYKITASLAYEKESPDMATQNLKALIDYNASAKPKWTFEGESVDLDFFKLAIQEYCFNLFKVGSPAAYESFKSVSEKMLSYYPKDTRFMNNIGSYYLVYKKDNKSAVKYYTKVLKIDAQDYSALKNLVLAARYDKNTKLEVKYLPALIKVTEDSLEKSALEARLSALTK